MALDIETRDGQPLVALFALFFAVGVPEWSLFFAWVLWTRIHKAAIALLVIAACSVLITAYRLLGTKREETR